MFHRPPDLPRLRPREMAGDRPYIGSSLHNDVMMWLFSLLRSIWIADLGAPGERWPDRRDRRLGSMAAR